MQDVRWLEERNKLLEQENKMKDMAVSIRGGRALRLQRSMFLLICDRYSCTSCKITRLPLAGLRCRWTPLLP